MRKSILKFITISLLIATFIPAVLFAQDAEGETPKSTVTPYGEVRGYWGYRMIDYADADTEDTKYMQNTYGGSSKIGLKFDHGKLKGKVAVSLKPSQSKGDTAQMDTAWAEYDFGSLKLTTGTFDRPWYFSTNEFANGWNGLEGFGALDDGNGNKIGYMVSAKGAYLYLTSPHLPTGTSGENMIPLVGIGYKLAAGPAEVTVGGAFHSVKPLTKDDDAITSFLGHANVSATFGIVSVLANFGYAVNPGNMGLNGLPKGSGDGAKDTSMIDALAEVGVQAGPGVARVGFGMKRNDNGADADNTTTDKAYYVHYDLDINKYIKIAPEVSIHDMDGGDKTTFIGVFTRMKM